MDVAERIAEAGTALTAAERRVAEIILSDPADIAFGTVAEVARASRSGAATVLRLAAKLGFEGFTGLQSAVQHELANQLRPAAERIRQPRSDDPIERQLQHELANVRATLGQLDADVHERIVAACADEGRRVVVASGDASRGIAVQFMHDLSALRDGVALLDGNEIAVRRLVSTYATGDLVVAIDYRRYDRWLVDAVTDAKANGLSVVALTDSVLSPFAQLADDTIVVAAASASPFDSHVGTLAALNSIVAGVADARRAGAAERLARAESAWQAAEALIDR